MTPETIDVVCRYDGEMQHAAWHPKLQTIVRSIAYDFAKKIGRLFMPDLCCTHGPAVIELFEALDPGCERIETYAGNVPDTVYLKRFGEWRARVPRL